MRSSRTQRRLRCCGLYQGCREERAPDQTRQYSGFHSVPLFVTRGPRPARAGRIQYTRLRDARPPGSACPFGRTLKNANKPEWTVLLKIQIRYVIVKLRSGILQEWISKR
jgi:hypothetical protein